MTEREVLSILLYKVGDHLSPNLHGFMKDRFTSDCLFQCLSMPGVTCQAFVDLKGAFDRANQDVIMKEPVMKVVRSRLLSWIKDYLSGRRTQVVVQYAVATEEVSELGAPQGGVLSPMLFNVLMNKIVLWPFPGDIQVFIFADDILVQCSSSDTLCLALRQLSTLCEQMGFVVSESKTKF